MKCKEEKHYYETGQLFRHYFVDESGSKHGEYRNYYRNGQLRWHRISLNSLSYGEVKEFTYEGGLQYHYLMDGEENELATVIEHGRPATHTESQLIEIAKEHNLPLLSELPKTEAEVTLWNLKWPDFPCLPIESE